MLLHGPSKRYLNEYHWHEPKVGIVASYTPDAKDVLDHFGIFNRELNRYTHQLRIVKRLLPDEPDLMNANEDEEVVVEELAGQGALFG